MKVIKVFALLLLLFISGCEKAPSEIVSVPSPNPSDEVNTIENPESNIADIIVGVWEIQLHAKNAIDGTNYDLHTHYGSGLKYGGQLTFNEDGTFSRYIGITGDGDYEGSYFVEGNEITFNFDGGSIAKATYLPSSQEIEYYNAYDPPFYEYFMKVD